MRGTRLGILAIALAAAVGLLWWLTRPEAPRDRAEREAPAGAVASARTEVPAGETEPGTDEEDAAPDDDPPPEVTCFDSEAFVAGVVVDRVGHPIEGAQIYYPQPVTTGPDGAFRVEGLPLAPLRLAIHAAGFAPTYVRCNPWQTDVRVVMQEFGVAEVTVRMPDGSPAAGAMVQHLTCDAAGKCVVEELAPGPTTLNAERDGRVGVTRLDVEAGRRHAVTIRLGEPGPSFLRLLVLGAAGKPVSVRCSWTAGAANGAVTTDVRGQCAAALPLPPATRVRVTLSNVGRSLAATVEVLTLASADDDPHVVRLPPAERFWVVARGAGGEALPSGVTAEFRCVGRARLEEAQHDRARYVFDPEAPMLSLTIKAPGYVEFQQWDWPTPASGAEVEVPLRRGTTIRGTVVRSDGSPVREAYVSATPVAPRRFVAAGTDERGVFEIRGVPPGEVDVYATADDSPAEKIGRFTAGSGVLDVGTWTLPGASHVAGIVTDASERPVAGAAVRTISEGEESGEAFTTSDGRFRLPIASTRETFVLVSRPGSATRVVPTRDANLIVLAAGTCLAVRVTYNPAALRDAMTYAVRDPATGATWTPPKRDRTSERGELRWTYEDLPPGPLDVLVYRGMHPHVGSVDVRADGTSAVTIDLGDG